MKTDDYGSIRIGLPASALAFACIPEGFENGIYITISLYLSPIVFIPLHY